MGSTAEKAKAIDLFSETFSWSERVPNGMPAELEIGSGKGLFLTTASAMRPNHYFVGVELARKFANRAADRIHRNGRTNASMLCGDARRFLAECVPSESVVAVHVYFPDPWWRNRHKKRRVLNEETITHIERVLQPNGELHFWTDVLDYYQHIGAELMDRQGLSGPRYVPERQAAHSMDYSTHFERRARTHGQAVYRAIFTKLAGDSPA